jgi:hypothetical protein
VAQVFKNPDFRFGRPENRHDSALGCTQVIFAHIDQRFFGFNATEKN